MGGGVICPKSRVNTLSWTFGLVSPTHWPGKALGGGAGSEVECAHSTLFGHSFTSQSISRAGVREHEEHRDAGHR